MLCGASFWAVCLEGALPCVSEGIHLVGSPLTSSVGAPLPSPPNTPKSPLTSSVGISVLEGMSEQRIHQPRQQHVLKVHVELR